MYPQTYYVINEYYNSASGFVAGGMAGRFSPGPARPNISARVFDGLRRYVSPRQAVGVAPLQSQSLQFVQCILSSTLLIADRYTR